MRIRVRDQLLRGHVYDVVVAREYVVQLRLHALGDYLGRVLAVELVHAAVDQVLELAVGVLYLGREEPVGQELYLLAHVGNSVRVRDDRLIAVTLAQVGELLEHLVRGAEIERVGPVGVAEFLGREQDAAVNLVARVEEVHVSRGHHGLLQLMSQARNAPVEVTQALVVPHGAVLHQEAVVGERHDLKVVIEAGQPLELLGVRAAQHGVKHLASLAGGAYEQALAVLHEQALGDDGVTRVVLQVAGGYELVEVLQAHLVAHQQRYVPHAAAAGTGEPAHDLVDVAELFRPLVVQHGDELLHHAGHDLRVVERAVMVELRQAQVLADYVQLVAPQLGQQALGEDERIHHYRMELYAAAGAGRGHEARVEGGVVGDNRPASGEVEKRAHGLGLAGRAGHVAVLYAGQLRDIGRDVHARVHEGAESVQHPPAGEAHGADLGQAVRRGGQARRLHVEGYELALQRGVALPAHGGTGVNIVDVVPLQAVNNLHAVLLPRLAHLGEGLRRTVVGDGDGLVAPGGGTLHHLGRVGQGVEGGVARVQVKLNALVPLMAVGAHIHIGDGDGHRVDDHVVVELVKVHLAAHDDAHAVFHLAGDGGVLAAADELAHTHAARVVGHVEAEYVGPALLDLAVVDGKDLALHRYVPALEGDGGHIRRGICLAQGLAVEELAVLRLGLGLLRHYLRALGVESYTQQPVLAAQAALQGSYIPRRHDGGKARVDSHVLLVRTDYNVFHLGLVQPSGTVAQGLTAREYGQKGYAQAPTSLSISSISAPRSSSSGTRRTISPFLNSSPQPLPPAMP